MESILYIEPSGDSINNPTVAEMLAFMRQEDDEYWGPYSPVGQLESGSPPQYGLLFVRHQSRGWFLLYTDYTTGKKLVVVDPVGDRAGWVEHWAEGDIFYFLAACFVPQSLAERVVEDFLTSRQPSTAATWEPFDGRLHWREGPPEDEAAILEVADPEG